MQRKGRTAAIHLLEYRMERLKNTTYPLALMGVFMTIYMMVVLIILETLKIYY